MKRTIYWLVSLGLAGILLLYAVRGINWHQIGSIFGSAHPPLVFLSGVLISATLFLRSCRWRVILSGQTNISIPLVFWATAAGYLGNSVLPARAGEVVRALMVSSRTSLSRAFVLTTALLERVVDAIAVVTISSVVLFTMEERPGWLAGAGKPVALLGLCGVLIVVIVPAFEVFWFKLVALLPLPPALRGRVEGALRGGLRGMRSFHDYARLGRFIAATAIIWSSDAVTAIVLARSINLLITLPMAFLLTAGLALGSALPSTPGYLGIYQFVAVSILTPFGLSRAAAIAYILMFQALNYLIVLSLGGIGFARSGGLVVASEVFRPNFNKIA
jgi:uncharacterized protein (TIRG00374 family)